MTTADIAEMAHLLSMAVAHNAEGRPEAALRCLERIPEGQERRAEEILAHLRNAMRLQRESGVDFGADGRPLVAMAALTPDDPSLPEEGASDDQR